jgi:cytochrome c
MDFLDKLVIPQKGANLEFLNYLLVMAKIIFITYSGVLFGSFFMSNYFRLSRKKDQSTIIQRYTESFIDLITSNKTIGFGLGLVPFLSIITLYAHLLNGSGIDVTGYLAIAFVIYLLGMILAYSYKHSVHLQDILKTAHGKEDIEEGDLYHYAGSMNKLASRSSFWGIILLFVSLWIFSAAVNLASNQSLWSGSDNLAGILFNFSTITNLLQFISMGFAVTGLAFIVKIFFWDRDTYHPGEEFTIRAKRLNVSLSLVMAAVQPIFIALHLLITPSNAMSNTVFAIALIMFISVFFLANMLYFMLKNNTFNYSTPAFYLALIVMASFIVIEQVSFATSNRGNIARLSYEYDKEELRKMEAAGLVQTKIDGGDIYKVKCMACHRFEEKLVGPPHKVALKKYINKREELIRFLLNPVKVDPAYPPMPNQALKPKEAEAVADYMFKEYGGKL